MRALLLALALALAPALAGYSSLTTAQTTAGTSATIVVPVIAQTPSFGSEVTAYNPNAGAIMVNVAFYDANNTASPGPQTCLPLSLLAGQSVQFSMGGQCTLAGGSNFGLLVLSEQSGTQRFYAFARTQTPSGVGFSTEGFPIENFNDQLQHVTGLKRQGAAPAVQTNCFVASLADAVTYELRLFDGTTNAQIGGTLSGSLAAYEQYRYLDVFAQVGAPAADYTNVRAQFTNLTASNKKLIGFCTVQENQTFSADFRIAKSFGGTPQNAFVQGGNAFGTTALLGTIDDQPLEIILNGERVMRYEGPPEYPNVIGGYSGNSANGHFAVTIAGGGIPGTHCGGQPLCSNQVTGTGGTIGGGYGNAVAADVATVAGGLGNIASGSIATVSGGAQNSATGVTSVVAGGVNNIAANYDATVSGGANNTASGYASAVAGGRENIASGLDAMVVGGAHNAASGDGSFAVGHRAKASARGAFVWSDVAAFDFESVVENSFSVRATGGVEFTVAIDPTTGAATQSCNLLPGVSMWQCTSDRNAKDNVVPALGKEILSRLVAMPMYSWTFRGADPSLRNLGPMAQDFYAAFGLGNSDTTIASGNVEGVALAAIQGLNSKLEERVAELQREVAELRERVSAAESVRADVGMLRAALAELQHSREITAAR